MTTERSHPTTKQPSAPAKALAEHIALACLIVEDHGEHGVLSTTTARLDTTRAAQLIDDFVAIELAGARMQGIDAAASELEARCEWLSAEAVLALKKVAS